MTGRARGRAWATAAFILGIGVSVAGNVAHASYPSHVVLTAARAAGETWQAPIGARAMAAFFPLALLLTVEILARVPWPRTFGWNAARYGGAALVAGVAAVVSYNHLNGLLRVYGEDELTARIGPLSVDGLMVVSGFALLAIGRHNAALAAPEPVREPVPEVQHVPAGAPVRPVAWPPFVLDQGPTEALRPVDVPAVAAPAEEPTPVPDAVPEPGPEQVRAAREFAEEIARGAVPSIRRIKKQLRIGQPKASQVRAYLSALADN